MTRFVNPARRDWRRANGARVNRKLDEGLALRALPRHTNIATTRIYERRKSRLEDSPTFKVAY
ncbi:hypothetical protein [Caballeronia telluris]|uniref:Uncharacterized protein n=1 Tax=Caballeronia telluris TaxID=326475 RepID=A0A158KHL0_9BURK|nr:hypothetical protein [Caballeronia telluris]SAL80587.1 hypothetical protein AWB66_06278 [Caballeronia telluris]